MKHIILAVTVLISSIAAVGCGGSLLSRFGIRIEGDHIVFNDHINFATGSDEILEESHDLLDGLAQTLNEHPEIHEVRVEGHTDSAGDAADNLSLSNRRAASVVTYLRAAGVVQTLTPEGRGETQLLCEDETDDCNARNRRVEFVIIN
ncbi:MAG: OmpA family protein [Sandaracinaceae bacterium]|jgi:OOP family OmpA-OmpF porin|nr:OmpA family protein [Sandaracinaceae bacterium]MBP7681164.1 OmpA family protein [Deltaproteobacteria bacterium]MBK6808891.1 OmpA family protein [Sandaracinaceae bacterium]MBK7153315.1 OmpA family protein [Sandaracinaceae bacterium]MBK7772777.1 OmpA family protein [Sandaracinaceae bacterium]